MAITNGLPWPAPLPIPCTWFSYGQSRSSRQGRSKTPGARTPPFSWLLTYLRLICSVLCPLTPHISIKASSTLCCELEDSTQTCLKSSLLTPLEVSYKSASFPCPLSAPQSLFRPFRRSFSRSVRICRSASFQPLTNAWAEALSSGISLW